MTREEVFETLTEIFRDNFDEDDMELSEETTAEDIEGWDSMEQINLVVAIQKKFNIQFNVEEVNAMSNIGEMADLILKKV